MNDERFRPAQATISALRRLISKEKQLPASRSTPLSHYLRGGEQQGISPHWLFDAGWYRAQVPSMSPSENALAHYVSAGDRDGLKPHPLFDPTWYRAQLSTALSETALAHYVREGEAAGLSPHPLFDPTWYAMQAGTPRPAEGLLRHYLVRGDVKGLSPHPLFDPAWYRRQLEGRALEETTLAHYLRQGDATGLSPHPLFDPVWYRWRHGLPTEENALVHLLRTGFDLTAYIRYLRDASGPGLLRDDPLIIALHDRRRLPPKRRSEPATRQPDSGNRLLRSLAREQDKRREQEARQPRVLGKPAWRQAAQQQRAVSPGNTRIIVYTCCFGNYEALKEPLTTDPSVRFIAFTDNPALSSKHWEICVLSDFLGDARRSSRLPKILPHLYLPDHDVSVYIDASMEWRAPDVHRMLSECLEDCDVGLYRHHRRDCVFDEMDICASLGIEHPEVLAHYRSHYQALGVKRNAGLFENGFIVRRNTAAARAMNEAWWHAYRGQRDQLALSSALVVSGTEVNAIKYGKQMRLNEYVNFWKHERPSLPLKEPKLYVFIAYAPPSYAQDLGRAYNDYMELIEEDAFALFLDHDAMFCSPDWFKMVQKLVTGYEGVECLVVGRTNRIGNPYQRVGVLMDEHRSSAHEQLAAYLNEAQRDWVANVASLDSTSGVIMMLSKRTWRKVPFSSGFLKVDNRMHIAFRESGRPVLMPASLYAYHFYRADGDQSHAVLLDDVTAPSVAPPPPTPEDSHPHVLKNFVIDEAAGLDLAHYAHLLRDGEWAVFLRADAMFCDKTWYPRAFGRLQDLAPDQVVLFGNNLVDAESPSSDDVMEHRAYAATRVGSTELSVIDRALTEDDVVAFLASKATIDALVASGGRSLEQLIARCNGGTNRALFDASTHVFCRSMPRSGRQLLREAPPSLDLPRAFAAQRRVGILTLGFWPAQAGMELMIHNLATHLTLAGDLVTLYAPKPDKPFEEIRHNYLLKRFRSERHFFEMFRRQHAVLPFDVLLVQGGLEAASMALALKDELGIAVVLRTHGEDIQVDDGTKYGYRRDAVKRAVIDSNIRRVDRNVVIGEHIAPLVKAIAPDTIVHTIHNGVDIDRFRPQQSRYLHDRLGLADDRLVLLTVGRNVKKKAFHLAVHALKSVLERVPQAVLVHAGRQGNGENLTEVARSLGVERAFYALGEVNYFDTPLIYAGADLFVFPSKVETFGNVTVEALSSGLPCVEFDYEVNRHKIDSGVNGYVVPFGEVEQLADRIVELLLDPERRQRFSQAARAKAVDVFAWQRVAQNYRDVFQQFRAVTTPRPRPSSGHGWSPLLSVT